MSFFNIDFDSIKADNSSTEDADVFMQMYNSAIIDLSKPAPPVKPLLSIGSRMYNKRVINTHVMTEGEMSAIVAPSKTMKTFFLGALIAGYIGGDKITSNFPQFKSHRQERATVLHFDTEQGAYYAHKAFKRTLQLGNSSEVKYVPFATRKMTSGQRLALIDGILKRSLELYNDPIKLVAIDGIADLVDNTNDIVMSKEASDYVMKWTSIYNLHILCVIHKNFGENSKPVGHLGSFITKKAETVFLLERDKEVRQINVTCDYSRGFPFEPFSFYLDKDSLPYQTDTIEIINSDEVGGIQIAAQPSQTTMYIDEEIPF